MNPEEIGLPEALERAARALPELADRIRPANGDPGQLARELSPDEARAALEWLLREESAAGEELARSWAEDPETASWVLELDPSGLPKSARKGLKRLTHRLRSQGLATTAAPAARSTRLAPLDEQIDEARISAADPYGARAAYLASDRPGGGVRLFQVIFDEQRGILDFELFETGRSRARRFLRDLTRRPQWPAAETPPESVRAVIAEAVLHQPSDRALPKGFGDWSSRLCDFPEGTRLPGALVREALGEAAAAEPDFETLEAWLESGSIGPWPPAAESLEELFKRFDEIAEGRVIVSEAAREQQIDQALEEVMDRVYDAAGLARLASRLDETAYVWWKTDREADARQLLAGAEACRTGVPGARRLARRMLERALAPALARVRAPQEVKDAESEEPQEALIS